MTFLRNPGFEFDGDNNNTTEVSSVPFTIEQLKEIEENKITPGTWISFDENNKIIPGTATQKSEQECMKKTRNHYRDLGKKPLCINIVHYDGTDKITRLTPIVQI